MDNQSPISSAIDFSKETKRLLEAKSCPIPCEDKKAAGSYEMAMLAYATGVPNADYANSHICGKSINFRDCQKYKDHVSFMISNAKESLGKVEF